MVTGSWIVMITGDISNSKSERLKVPDLLIMKKELVMRLKIEMVNGLSFLLKREKVMVDIG